MDVTFWSPVMGDCQSVIHRINATQSPLRAASGHRARGILYESVTPGRIPFSYRVAWIRSHPERKKLDHNPPRTRTFPDFSPDEQGIFLADLVAGGEL